MNRYEIEFHPDAVLEAREAAAWYAARSIFAAEAFVAELDAAISRLEIEPEMWLEFLPKLRRTIFKCFPYTLVHRINGNQIQVIAVAHGRRRPGYWRLRSA